jgi:methyl-accepting chemotaxis protein
MVRKGRFRVQGSRVGVYRFMMKNRNAKNHTPDFRKKYLIYFIPAIFIIFFLGVELIYEVGSDGLYKKIVESISSKLPGHTNNPDMSEVRNILKSFHVRVIMVVSFLFLCFAVSAIMFYRNFVKPVDKMAKGVQRMAGGHLNELIQVSSDNEIGKIGELINDLAINMQEILLNCKDMRFKIRRKRYP